LVSHIKGRAEVEVFENRVLRRIFGPMMKEVAEERGRMNNEELHNLYASPKIIRVNK
jgi:hypothetical protein